MSQETSDTPGNCPVLIRINLLDCFASSTKVKADSNTTTNDLCEILSTKLGLSETDAMFYSLVCVSRCMEKRSMHWVRTLKASDRVLEVQSNMIEKAIGRCATPVIAKTVTSSFYYKDIRSNPLDLDGDASGDSSSDDEMEIPLNDLMYFGSGERRAFLHKRSSSDPNVWRRRLCILNDKLWCIDVRKGAPSASCVNLNDASVLEDRPDLKYTNTIILNGNNGKTLFFRTNAPLEKHRWREEIRERTLYGADNEVMMMAEMIITDEEEMAEVQMQKCFREVLQAPQVWRLVGRILGLTADGALGEQEQGNFDISTQQFEEKEEECDSVSSDRSSRRRSRTEENAVSSMAPSSSRSRGSLSPPRGSLRRSSSSAGNSSHSDSNRRKTYSPHNESWDGSGSRRRRDTSTGFTSAELKASSSSRRSLLSAAAPQNNPNLYLSKKFGRWSSQIFHVLHQANPACAAGVSVICAVQHYRGSFRHDFYVGPKELWGNALHVYINHILPYMDHIKFDTSSGDLSLDAPVVQEAAREISEESVDEVEHRKNTILDRSSLPERPSVTLTPSQHITMEEITQLHRALFSNIRKKRKKTIVSPSDATKSRDSAPASPSYSSWFWSSSSSASSEKSSNSSSKGNDKLSDIDDSDDIYNTDYAVLDKSIKPNIDMYDNFVEAVYKKLQD